MRKTSLVFLITIITSLSASAQFSRYIIKFRDKGTNPFTIANPSQYLTQRALDRRSRYNIAIDSSDLPVTPGYIDSVRLSGNVTILNSSKWLNQVAIQTTDAAALAKINSFPFVLSSSPIAARTGTGLDMPVNKKMDSSIAGNIPAINRPAGINDYYHYGLSSGQVKIHQGDFLHNHGFRGEGMQMAVLDAGFYHYKSLQTFDSIRTNQILGTWDFVAREESVDEDYSHGMQCLSTIAANIPGVFVGTAPKTSFYLYRTEDVSSEYPIEEQNFAAGTERADSLGVDICSVSLGYNQFDNSIFNYTYGDMNGNTTISARAAAAAAKKGILMVIAAGNEGNNSWHYLITPSDADSVLSVGAVDTTGIVGSFSSYGPSGDGQVKPAVAAVGVFAVVANTANGLPSYGFGTSFACPNMAGISSCLWQAFPEVSNMDIINTLESSANNFNTPDNRTGYGVPDAKKAFVMLQKKLYRQQNTIAGCVATVQFAVKTDNTMSVVVERRSSTETNYTAITTLQNSNAYGMHDFSYDDDLASVSLGAVKYRFKMIIGTDTTFYLDSMVINHADPCVLVFDNEITIRPNPVYNDLNVKIDRASAAKINIVVQNTLGQKVYNDEFQQAIGTQLKTIPMKRMARGIYFITVYIDNKKAVTKEILRK
ncbi:hypothetical protein BH11BAC4_BH11BAC4_20750 [soil metagenome]